MATVNISLPDGLKHFVDEQVEGRGLSIISEYVRDLIRRDQVREKLRALILEGAESGGLEPVDEAFFSALREHALKTGA